jgi:hypothetical protein
LSPRRRERARELRQRPASVRGECHRPTAAEHPFRHPHPPSEDARHTILLTLAGASQYSIPDDLGAREREIESFMADRAFTVQADP